MTTTGRPQVDRAAFERQGYLHLRGVFAPAEVAELRAAVEASERERAEAGADWQDLLSNPHLARFVLDDRVLTVIKALVGREPVYFGDSSYTVRPPDGPTGRYHKDNADRLDADAPDWQSPYTLIRVGTYLQDHSRQGGGLLIKARSHNRMCKNRYLEVLDDEVVGWLDGRSRYMASRIGDLLVWSMRTTHAPMGRYVRGLGRRPISRRAAALVPSFLTSACHEPRYFLAASFGRRDAHLERYLRSLKTRAYMVESWRRAEYPAAGIEALGAKGIAFLDMRAEIEADIAAGREVGHKAKWAPLAY